MSADVRAFLRAIAAAPDDDTPRLVFADWLDENGNPPRAEFIRVEIELTRTPPGDPRRGPLFERRAALYRTHADRWFALFQGKATAWATERGFVTAVTAGPVEFLKHAGDWFGTQPVTRLKLSGVWSGYGADRACHAREVFTSPHLAPLTHLDLEFAGVNSAGVYWLAHNAGLVNLRELVLRQNVVTDDGAATLAGMAGLAGLESLDLAMNRLTDAGARHLIASPRLTNLRELRITKNRISPRAWRALEDRFGRVLVG
jgi:uncharacterized protein (TIGR02996 family)